jgi:hypothetical protein
LLIYSWCQFAYCKFRVDIWIMEKFCFVCFVATPRKVYYAEVGKSLNYLHSRESFFPKAFSEKRTVYERLKSGIFSYHVPLIKGTVARGGFLQLKLFQRHL